MNKFKIGDRVVVTDERNICGTNIRLKGFTGTVTEDTNYPNVKLDQWPEGYPDEAGTGLWSFREFSIELINK